MDTSFPPRRLRHLLFDWLPMLAWMAWIYWLSAQPKLPHPGRRMGLSDYLFDYSAHAFTFAVLCVLTWRVLRTRRPIQLLAWRGGTVLGAGVLAALYAITDEVHQAFVPGRWALLTDWLADVAGILVAAALLALWQRWRTKTKEENVSS